MIHLTSIHTGSFIGLRRRNCAHGGSNAKATRMTCSGRLLSHTHITKNLNFRRKKQRVESLNSYPEELPVTREILYDIGPTAVTPAVHARAFLCT